MKKVIFLAAAFILLVGIFVIYYSPVLVRVEKNNFIGGTLEIDGMKFQEEAGSGTEYHIVFVTMETEARVSCGDGGNKLTSSGGYLTPWLQWYVSLRLSNCSIEDFRSLF
jgi:hypothetical protein